MDDSLVQCLTAVLLPKQLVTPSSTRAVGESQLLKYRENNNTNYTHNANSYETECSLITALLLLSSTTPPVFNGGNPYCLRHLHHYLQLCDTEIHGLYNVRYCSLSPCCLCVCKIPVRWTHQCVYNKVQAHTLLGPMERSGTSQTLHTLKHIFK